jgi:hypothetical protein
MEGLFMYFSLVKRLILLMTLISMPAIASTTGGFVQITDIYATHNGAVLFSGGPRSGVPACGINNPNRWAIDASTPAGQAAASVLITAWMNKKRVWVTGFNSCSIWGDTETVLFFNVEN